MRLELKPRRAGGGCGLEIVHAPSGPSCDYCLLLHDCILISPCLLSTRHSPRSVYSASLDTSHVPLRPCNNPSNFVDVPSCPSSTRPTSTLDDGDRASRSILRSFAGHISPQQPPKDLAQTYSVSLKTPGIADFQPDFYILRPLPLLIPLVSNTFKRWNA